MEFAKQMVSYFPEYKLHVSTLNLMANKGVRAWNRAWLTTGVNVLNQYDVDLKMVMRLAIECDLQSGECGTRKRKAIRFVGEGLKNTHIDHSGTFLVGFQVTYLN